LHGLRESSRQTTIEHLQCFSIHLPEDKVFYLNFGEPIPRSISACDFDIFIVNYDFLNYRFSPLWKFMKNRYRDIAKRSKYRISIAQDDFWANDYLDTWVRDWQIDRVLTPLDSNLDFLYPKSNKNVEFKLVLTGYVAGEVLYEPSYPKLRSRGIDLGQRVRYMPANLGRFAQEKAVQAEKFAQFAADAGFKVDVSTDAADSILGSDWFTFLQNSKFTVSMKGGASLNDPKGKLYSKVQAFVSRHPEASFDDIEKECFPGKDMLQVYSAISPRIFEAALAGTCQILRPDNYLDVMNPWEHYIPLNEDFSNIEMVLEAMADLDACQQIADNAFTALVSSGIFNYSKFVEEAVGDLKFDINAQTQAFKNLAIELENNRYLFDKLGEPTHDLLHLWLHDKWMTGGLREIRKIKRLFGLHLNAEQQINNLVIEDYASTNEDYVALTLIVEKDLIAWLLKSTNEILEDRWFSRQVWQWRPLP
jgi:hypothetical protein